MSSAVAGTAPLLGEAGGVGNREPQLKWETTRRIIIGVAFAATTFLFIPISLKLALEDVFSPIYIGGFYLTGVTVLLFFVGRNFARDNAARREQRRYNRTAEAVWDGTYQCVTPQVLNSLVVFPILVSRRDADRDGIVDLDDTRLVVELAQGGSVGAPVTGVFGSEREEQMKRREAVMKKRAEDTETRITALISSAIASPRTEFGVKIFSGSGGGPTGLSAGVSCPDYGPQLAAYVGHCLERHSTGSGKKGVVPPPPAAFSNGKVVGEKSD